MKPAMKQTGNNQYVKQLTAELTVIEKEIDLVKTNIAIAEKTLDIKGLQKHMSDYNQLLEQRTSKKEFLRHVMKKATFTKDGVITTIVVAPEEVR